MNGARAVGPLLRSLGIDHVFGLPGTQNLALCDGLHDAPVRLVTATDELAAGFMAVGHYRASGRLAALLTIPGPGLTYALTALAEARLDSVPLLHLTTCTDAHAGRRFRLQELDTAALLRPLVKSWLRVESGDELAAALATAVGDALAGEPGPVSVEIDNRALGEHAEEHASLPERAAPPAAALAQAVALLRASRRPVIYAGLGAQASAAAVVELAGLLGAAVLTTTSGRGVIPADDPRALPCDFAEGGAAEVNALLAGSDLVLALGCKFSHNGSGGFALDLPADRFVHVDAAAEVLNANYPARLAVCADVADFTAAMVAALGGQPPREGWPPADLATWKRRLEDAGRGRIPADWRLADARPDTMAGFFAALGAALPADALVVTDSGRHQMLARMLLPVRRPRGLIVPADLQSMGFGIPAAIGARLAAPDAPVVALVGDGGFAQTATELLTAAREGVDLRVIVFHDGRFGLIHGYQVRGYGRATGTDLATPDFAGLAAALGAGYQKLSGPVSAGLERFFADAGPGVRILEVPLVEDPGLGRAALMARGRSWLRGLVGEGAIRRLRGGGSR